uniref:C2H2-type domain-containing protein n=1 Tax=Tetraodon nigroviridis TaxID=99883 RepID=H3CA50_TETNG
MAAMVLSSLSCSPLLHGPAQSHTAAALVNDCGWELLEDDGERWGSCHGNRSSTPSSPTEEVPSDEPAVRKRRSSGKTAYKCLWPCCGKLLTSVVGIKRHVRTNHLRHALEHERCDEDFYYTEVNQWEQPHSLPVSCGPAPTPSSAPASSSWGGSPPPPSPPSPTSGALSCSAPSSSSIFWQVQSEHSYQVRGHADSPFNVSTPQTLVRVAGRSRLRVLGRRPRGEAKKCRKVYGVEHRERWCTACRWKKACQRFTD